MNSSERAEKEEEKTPEQKLEKDEKNMEDYRYAAYPRIETKKDGKTTLEYGKDMGI